MTSTLNMEGEAVRVSLGGGTFMHADVQEVNGDSVKVKGRWFNIADVQTEEEIEQLKRANVEAGRRLRKAEEDAKLAVEAALKGAPKVPVFLAQAVDGDETVSAFVAYLQRGKYRLYLSCKPDLVGQGEDEYLVWTGGESLPEDAVRTYENAYGREWFLTFNYSADIAYPVAVIERGTGGGQGTPSILHSNGRCELCYWQVIEQLVRAGLRA